MSNSKLTPNQKVTRKALMGKLREMHGDNFVLVAFAGATVALVRTGKLRGAFAVAIASEGEQKFRRKVGEYIALSRMNYGESLPIVLQDLSDESREVCEEYLRDRALDIARSITAY